MQFSGVKKTAGVHGKSGRTKKVYFLQRIYLQCRAEEIYKCVEEGFEPTYYSSIFTPHKNSLRTIDNLPLVNRRP